MLTRQVREVYRVYDEQEFLSGAGADIHARADAAARAGVVLDAGLERGRPGRLVLPGALVLGVGVAGALATLGRGQGSSRRARRDAIVAPAARPSRATPPRVQTARRMRRRHETPATRVRPSSQTVPVRRPRALFARPWESTLGTTGPLVVARSVSVAPARVSGHEFGFER